MKEMNRRSLVRRGALALAAAALLVGTASGCAPAAEEGSDELTTLRVALGWVPNVEFGGFWIADDAGYYAEEGLKIEWIPGGPDAPNPEAAVAAGDADLGLSADTKTLIDATADGNPFSLLGTVYQRGPGCLLSLADNPVVTVEDLSGKTFLAQDEAVVAALFAVNDLDPNYTFVPTSFDPGPLVEGQGDAYTAYITNQAVAMQTSYGLTEGKDFTCVLYADLKYPTYSSVIFAEDETVEDQRDAIVGFLRASARGWLENAEDPAAAAQLATDVYGVNLGLDLEQQTLQNEAQIPLIQTDFTDEEGILRIDEDYLGGPIYNGLRATGSSDLPPVDQIVDQTLLDDALAGISGG
jgi:ABC-type nitrate/sulfonate/bicarbonate transport system substrate-binding protein